MGETPGRIPARSRVYAYGAVLASCAIGAGLGWATGAQATCLLLAVIFCSLIGERAVGIASVALCSAVFDVLFLPSPAQFKLIPDGLRLTAFIVTAVLLQLLVRSRVSWNRRYRTVVDTVPAGIILIDSMGRIVDLNPMASEMFGYGANELKRQPLSLLLPGFALRSTSMEEALGKRKDGASFPAQVGFSACGVNGRREWIGFIQDISGQQEERNALRQAQRDLGLLMDMIPGIVWRSDVEDKINFVNQGAVDYIGESPENIRDRDAFIHPDDLPARRRAQQELIASGAPQETEIRIRGENGEYRWFQSRMRAVRDEQQKIVGYCGLLWDYEDQKRALDALAETTREFETLLECIPAMVLVKGTGSSVEYGNQRMLDFAGMTLEQFKEKGCDYLAHPDEIEDLVRIYSDCVANAKMFRHTYRWLRYDGTYVWIENSMNPLLDETGKVVKWYGVILDVTDRVRAEEVLKDNEKKFSEIIEGIPAMVFQCGPTGEGEFVNSRMLRFSGKTHDEMMGRGYVSIIHPEDVEEVLKRVELAVRTGVPFRETYRQLRADGEYVWVESFAHPFRGPDGAVTKWYGINVVIDELKRTGEALETSEAKFRLVVDRVPAMFCMTDPEGRPMSINRRMAEYTGIRQEELDRLEAGCGLDKNLLGTWATLIHPDDYPQVDPVFRHSAATGTPLSVEVRILGRDRNYRWFQLRGEPLLDAKGQIIAWFGLYLDIHEAREMEEQVTHLRNRLTVATQAAAVSELSASIAHELNQPLTAIIAHGEACVRWLSMPRPDIERAVSSAKDIVHDGVNAAEIVRRIRALFRKAPLSKSLVSLNQLIVEELQLFAAKFRESRIMVHTALGDEVPPLQADYVQIQQVLMNLIQNAIDAMQDTPFASRLLTLRSRYEGSLAVIEVEDQGGGIKDTTTIFETFFTTKRSGFGMGLSISKSIIEAHGGRLWAESKGNEGSIFRLTLPVAPSGDAIRSTQDDRTVATEGPQMQAQ